MATPYSPKDDEENNVEQFEGEGEKPLRRIRRRKATEITETLPEEERLLGRIMGPLKRSRPELYNMLNELEKSTGKRKTIILSEALHHFLIERKVIQSQLSLADLYEAWEFLAELQEHAIRNFIRLGTLLFSEEYQGMLELSRILRGEIKAEEIQPSIRLPPKAKDVTERLVDKLWKFMDPLIEWCLEASIKNVAKAMGFKQPTLPTKTNIPVEIIEEPEE